MEGAAHRALVERAVDDVDHHGREADEHLEHRATAPGAEPGHCHGLAWRRLVFIAPFDCVTVGLHARVHQQEHVRVFAIKKFAKMLLYMVPCLCCCCLTPFFT